MPLPTPGQDWPPKQLLPLLTQMQVWSAWYCGDPDLLTAIYGGSPGAAADTTGFYASQQGGFKANAVKTIRRWFWGEPSRTPERRTKLHVPIAADLCQASADLLFADPPTLAVDFGAEKPKNSPVADRLEELAGDGLYTQLAEAAEVGAALGGVYMRVTWDSDVEPDGPFLTSVHADSAWPEFSYGRLTAVTFWRCVHEDDKNVWRHLERHELQGGIGVVIHGLYEGTKDNLGRLIPLPELPATAGLAEYVDDQGVISTLTPGLAVAYVPNQRPQRRWRSHPLGSSFGRADLDGLEQMMDALDETMTSWMRDIRLGKARVFLAESMLRSEGPGKGASWDADQEIYAPLEILQNMQGNSGALPITAQQFAIRVDEHRATTQDLIQQICRTAGYSAQTFGEEASTSRTGPQTATEVSAREKRSGRTRDRKVRLWRPATEQMVAKLLAVDGALFGGPAAADVSVNVTFADGSAESIGELAQTAALLKQAQAASTKTLVQLVHPDWEAEEVDAEVALITKQTAVPDPTQFRPNIDPAPGATGPTDPPGPKAA